MGVDVVKVVKGKSAAATVVRHMYFASIIINRVQPPKYRAVEVNNL